MICLQCKKKDSCKLLALYSMARKVGQNTLDRQLKANSCEGRMELIVTKCPELEVNELA